MNISPTATNIDVIIPVTVPASRIEADARRLNGKVIIASLDETETDYQHIEISTTQAWVDDIRTFAANSFNDKNQAPTPEILLTADPDNPLYLGTKVSKIFLSIDEG